METKELPDVVSVLKADLAARVEKFNQETGLAVSGIVIEPRAMKDVNGKKVALNYVVGVSIEL